MNLTIVARLTAAYRLMLVVQPSSTAAERTFSTYITKLLLEAEPVPRELDPYAYISNVTVYILEKWGFFPIN